LRDNNSIFKKTTLSMKDFIKDKEIIEFFAEV
jgi:hypothetical protein